VEEIEERAVAVGFDDNYLYPFLLLAFSISRNSIKLPKILIANVNSTLSQESQKLVERFTSRLGIHITIYEAEISPKVKTSNRVSVAAYGRLWLADNIDEDFVYIDTDSLLLPGWESVFCFLDKLKDDSDLLLGAMPALENKTPPWPIQVGDNTQYRFHSSILVIAHDNWKKHFENPKNIPWQTIATMHDKLRFVGHDQPVLQYAAQGKYLHLPPDLVNFATTSTSSTKVLTSGVWRKPWTVARENYFSYITSLMMYQDYRQVFGVVKELDIYSKIEDLMFDYLASFPDLLEEVQLTRKKSELSVNSRVMFPYMVARFVYNSMVLARGLFNKSKFR